MNQEQQPQPVQLDLNKAINIIVRGVVVAQSRGAYKLEESEVLSQAIRFISPPDSNTDKQNSEKLTTDTNQNSATIETNVTTTTTKL